MRSAIGFWLSLILVAMPGSSPAEESSSLEFIDGTYPELLRPQFENESSIIDGPLTLDCRVTLHDRSSLDETLVEFEPSRNEFLLKFHRKSRNWWRIDIATVDGAKILRTITCKEGFVDTEVNCWENKYWFERHGGPAFTEPLHQKFNDEIWPYYLLERHLLPGLNYLPSPDFAFLYKFLIQRESPAESGAVQLMHDGLRSQSRYLATAKSIDDALQSRPEETGASLVRLTKDGWVDSVRNFHVSQLKGPDGAILDSMKDAKVWNFLTDLKWGEDRVECSGVTIPISCDVSIDAVDFWSSRVVAGSVQRNEIPDTTFDRKSVDSRPMISFYAQEKPPWYYKYWRRSVRYWKG